MSEKNGPVIIVGVDGVLNPWNQHHLGFVRMKIRLSTGEVFKVALNHNHGKMLMDLAKKTGSELMWASFWNEHANEHIGRRLGLPELPVIPISDEVNHMPRHKRPSTGAWKVRCVAESGMLAGRSFVWFDDEPEVPELAASDSRLGPHLVVPVPWVTGLNVAHIAQAERWLMATAAPV
ncbi:HAD domain-containing protein [Streptosporangium sp. NPDC023825]|uniref:HAD domain-containing protein n=1 Tax=Streptosporangium sp. NPDC023825 TaxID=3154909 RepID=UPI0034234264